MQRMILRLYVVALVAVLSAATSWAVCTIGTKTATIVPSSVYYPFAGGAPSITLTYNVAYNNITSNNSGPPCTANPTITVTHTVPAGTFSAPNCSFPLNIPNPSTGLNLSGSCNVTWTAPAAPAASYTHDASVAALPAQTALTIAATAVPNIVVRRIPQITIANVTNGNETGPVSGTIRVTQSNAISDATVVSLSYGGTATNGSDYNGPLTATIPVGATNVLVSLGTIDDAIVEGNETAIATITGVTGGPATLGTPVTTTNTITDNDTATVTITNTTEGSETGPANGIMTLTMSKVSKTATTINYGVTGTATPGTDYTGLSGSISIPPLTTDVTLLIAVLDDAIDDDAETVRVALNSTSNTRVTVGTPNNATNTILDDDTVGLAISGDPVTVAESGTTGNFSVALTSEPTGSVTVSLTGNDATEATLSTTTLTFTPANWNVAQTVTVTGVDDFVDDGDITFNLDIDPSGADYNTVASQTVAVTTSDDDTVGFTVTGGPVTVTEAGTTGTLAIVLQSEPTGNVTVDVIGNDASESDLSTSSLTFTSANWNVPQTVTVTGLDDFLDDGDQVFNLTIDPSGADYGILASEPATVTVEDDDTASIVVNPGLLEVQEFGTSEEFSVALTAEPTSSVTITITGIDATEHSLSTTTLTFTPTDWDIEQFVTVTGVGDNIVDGDVIVTLAVTATGGGYDAVDPGTTDVTTIDDDATGVLVSGDPINVSETGTSGQLSLVLGSEPTANVIVTLTASDTTEATISPATLTFTPANWNVTQIATVKGVDDTIVDGEIQSAINVAVTSSDPNYDGASVPPAEVNTTDNDIAGFFVAGGPITVAENGRSKRFSVVLRSTPSSNVVLSAVASDITEATARPATLTFTPVNWNIPQFVTVLSVDDSDVDGSIVSNISVSIVAAASDDEYDTLAPQSVKVTTLDNDVSQDDELVRRAFKAQTHNYLASRMRMLSSNRPQLFRMIRRDQGGFLFEGDGQSVKGDFALSSAALAKIAPTADFSPPAPQQDLNAWIEGRFAVYDTEADNAKGDFFVGYAGLDMRVSDNVAIGMMAQLDWSEERISNGRVDGLGWMVGPYVTAQPSANLFFDARALWGQSSNDVQQIVSGTTFEGDFTSERILLEGRLSGEFGTEATKLRPDVTLFWMKEFQGNYAVAAGTRHVDIDGVSASLGQLSAGLNFSHALSHDKLTIAPFIEPRLTWTFDDPGRMALDGTVSSQNDASASVTVGINVTGQQTQFSLDAAFESALGGGGPAWSGGIQFLHQF